MGEGYPWDILVLDLLEVAMWRKRNEVTSETGEDTVIYPGWMVEGIALLCCAEIAGYRSRFSGASEHKGRNRELPERAARCLSVVDQS